jgi:tetratricopeptide (TPR) repeat protein
MRPLVVVLLAACLGLSGGSRSSAQQPAAPQTFPANAWTAIAHGTLTEAETLAKSQPAGDPEAAAVLAHLAIRKGHYDEAVKILEPAAAQAPLSSAALELGLLHQRLGRGEAAAKLLGALFRQGARAGDAAVIARAARAAQALGNKQDANALFRAAAATSQGDPAIETAWGWLFFETSTEAEAANSFQRVLKADDRYAPAYVGMAAVLAGENPPAAAAAAMKALEIDPTLASAELILADLDLDNTRYPEARERIARVLAHNPNHLDARALLAATAYVKGDRATYDAELRKILEVHPAFGEAYRVAGDLAARNYRFEEAVALTRQAVQLDPTLARGYGDLGMHLLRTGDEAEARKALERSFTLDRTHRVTYNLLLMLDKLDGFITVEGDGVIVRMSPDEAPVVKEYAVPLAETALKTLSKKYQFTPKGPILIEIFPVHDDFAVRNLGLPGLIGALGACFGRVITMDSPTARKPPGSFSWQATLWHEMAHVITLQLSQQRVPRWLTEGISVYEEGKARPEWGREMEVAFAAALNRGKVLPLKDLNSGFTSPETIALSYFQASVLVDHIVRTFGEEKLRALVAAYADGSEPDAAMTKALGQSMAQLQGGFDASLEQRFGALRAALKPLPEAERAMQADADTLKAAVAANPGNFTLQLAYGRALASARDKAAFQPLERAASLVPVATGEDSPHLVMAELAEQLGDHARAVQEYLKLLAQDHTALEPARKLAALADKAGNDDASLVAYERMVALDPFDAPAHTGLGRLAMKKQQPDIAVREFKAVMALRPTDRASAHCDLGEAYLAMGRHADAKKEALAALELASTYERALELLLKATEGKTGGVR